MHAQTAVGLVFTTVITRAERSVFKFGRAFASCSEEIGSVLMGRMSHMEVAFMRLSGIMAASG